MFNTAVKILFNNRSMGVADVHMDWTLGVAAVIIAVKPTNGERPYEGVGVASGVASVHRTERLWVAVLRSC